MKIAPSLFRCGVCFSLKARVAKELAGGAFINISEIGPR